MPTDPARPIDIDQARLSALLDMAGPEMAAELAGRMVEDLSQVHAMLSGPGASANASLLRAQSHILIALSGTIGANGLSDQARNLGVLARDGLTGDIESTVNDLCRTLGEVIAWLELWLRRESRAS